MHAHTVDTCVHLRPGKFSAELLLTAFVPVPPILGLWVQRASRPTPAAFPLPADATCFSAVNS